MKADDMLKEALANGSLSDLTKALGKLADSMAYALKPPYTELLRLSAREENDHFVIDFAAKLYLHYSSLQIEGEGMVVSVTFSGRVMAENPSPTFYELFYTGNVDSLEAYGYGAKWNGKPCKTPNDLAEKLDLQADTLTAINLEEL